MTERFSEYCAAVCAQVRFRPDRQAIASELTAHMEDHMAALEAAGVPLAEAKRQAIAAMGDPEELGRALDRLHSPVLGWLQLWMRRLSRAAAAAAVVFLLLSAAGSVIGGDLSRIQALCDARRRPLPADMELLLER